MSCSRDICSLKLHCVSLPSHAVSSFDTLQLLAGDGVLQSESDKARLKYASKSSVCLRSCSSNSRSWTAFVSVSVQVSSALHSTMDVLTDQSPLTKTSSADKLAQERRCLIPSEFVCCLRLTAAFSSDDDTGLRSSETANSSKHTTFHNVQTVRLMVL